MASAAPVYFGGSCAIDSGNRAATIDALRMKCTGDEALAVYKAAPRGAVPQGVKDGWVTHTSAAALVAPAIWSGKTFHTGPNGGYLTNRTAIGDQWRADVYTTPSRIDGRPTWLLDYGSSPTPALYDEIREVVPGVWFGYSLMRDAGSGTVLLSFVLA
ncbi:MAG: hypothetical protein HOQ24_13125 [Mycobacteriaceae bacterium]|nr:hypothetical protein [Mycobacteriaceae bacterium]